MNVLQRIHSALLVGFVLIAVSCGGGGGGGGGSTTTPPPPVTTPVMFINISSLPLAVQGVAYSATVTATNGTGPFTWSVDNSSPNPLPTGLSIDPGTGVVSGMPSTSGNFTITFKVVDSSGTPQISRQNVTLTIKDQFTVTSFANNSLVEYQAANTYMVYISGGVPPYTASIVQGSLPPGLRLDPSNAWFMGAPNALGTYSVVIAVHDSYSPHESQQVAVTFTIRVPPLQIGSAIGQSRLILNKPYTGYFYATGGTPPYSFSAGTLPPGLTLSDPVNGVVSGTPTLSGTYTFPIVVTDSSLPPNNYQTVYFTATVATALGRNDTPAHATPIGNGGIQASISPLLDSTGIVAPDTDYYKVVASAGSTVHVETFAKRTNSNDPLDTAIELTDVNGAQLSTGCSQPGGTTTFTSPCLNDDISASPHIQDSSLDYKVPGTSGSQTFLIHVLDWSGNARPDMVYGLQVSGVINPILFSQTRLNTGTVGLSYSAIISATGGTGALSYSVANGSLPPGLAFSSGTISGTPTSAGTFNFGIQAADQGTPPQQSTAQLTIVIGNPLTISTTSLPGATAGTPYSAQLVSTGGIGPIQWNGYNFPAGLSVNATGLISGTPSGSGTYNLSVVATDLGANPANVAVSAIIPLTIH